MNLLYPELLLLGLPLGWLLWRVTGPRRVRLALRGLALLALLIALATPFGGGSVEGRDLVVVVDRSRSMPAGVAARTAELIELAGAEMRTGDRIALVTFGQQAAIENGPQADPNFDGFQTDPNADGSNLADALDRALALIPQNRPGSIVLYSDGEAQGADPSTVARRAAARGVRIDVRTTPRTSQPDTSVERMELPGEVEVGEPFQFQALVRAEQPTTAQYTLFRGEEVLARGEVQLRPGLNPLRFRDRGQAAGLAQYRLQIDTEGDRVIENNAAIGVTRVSGNRPILVINSTGQAGRLVNALRASGLQVAVHDPAFVKLQQPIWLESYRAFILENVPATELSAMLPALTRQVEDLGAGLMLTGGRASYGVGGYYLSALDPILPVTMELRVEHRKHGLAIAFVLDRSGSMGAPAGTGTKMDLANAGTMEAIRLLSPIDEATVIAVDSEAHLIVPLSQIDDSEGFRSRVSGIQSGGGGIYTFNGLEAAANQLANSTRANRHIVLFADAGDAEQPGQYIALLERLTTQENTTCSVVALGKPTDSDAAFLRDVASRGGGEIYFSEDANELPRLFAQDTMLAARSSMIDQLTPTSVAPGMFSIAAMNPGAWLNVPGYNLCYLRPGASLGVVTEDEYAAPLVASMQAGLGRTAAFTAQIDGTLGIPDADWPQAADLLVTMARWLAGQEPPAQYYAQVRREGRQAVVQVEVDPSFGEATPLTTRMVDPSGVAHDVELIPVGENRFEARVELPEDGIFRFAAVTEGGEVVPIDPVAVPYSPEYEPRAEHDSGERLLGQLARISGGRVNPPITDWWRGARGGSATEAWTTWFVLAGLLLLLSEIAWRRLLEQDFAAWSARRAALRHERQQERVLAAAQQQAAAPDTPASTRETKSAPATKTPEREPSAPAPPPAGKKSGIEDALAGIKKKRRR